MSDPAPPSWPPPGPGSGPPGGAAPGPGWPPPPGWSPPAGPGAGPPPGPGAGTTSGNGWSPPPATCYAHPGRTAGSVCRRCGRPICPDCMREAPVGWQCASCVKQSSRMAPVVRWRPGSNRGIASRVTPVVAVLVAVNVLVYLWEIGHPAFEYSYGLSPYRVHYQHHWYELITSAFLHENLAHIGLNMVSLVFIGPAIESVLGHVRFAAVYLLSALGGSVGFYLLAPADALALGASGAIFGLLGAWFVLARLNGWPVQSVIGLVVLNLVFSFAWPNVAWQDHIGGLVAGALAGLGMAYSPVRRPSPTAVAVQSAATCVVMLVVMGLLLQISPGHVGVGP